MVSGCHFHTMGDKIGGVKLAIDNSLKVNFPCMGHMAITVYGYQ